MADDKLAAAETEISEEKPSNPRRVRIITLSVIGGLLVLLGGAYVAGYFMTGDKVPRDTTMAGIEIGGLSAAEAEAKLAKDYAQQENATFTLVADGVDVEVEPEAAGLAVNYRATVESSGVGRSWDPRQIWRVLTGGSEVKPIAAVDEKKLEAEVKRIASEKVDREPKNAAVRFEGAEVKRDEGVTGRTLDQKKSAAQIKDGYLVNDRIEATVAVEDPALTTGAADRFVDSWAKKAVQGPVVVDTGKGTFEVTPEMIAGAASIKAEGKEFSGSIDGDKLYEAAQPAMDELGLKDAKEASYKFEGGKISVIPSEDGSEVSKESFHEVIVPAATSDEREVEVELSGEKAKFTTEEAEKRKPREVIGEFTTSFPHAAYRNTNLTLFAQHISGAVLRPGETFSVDEHVGPRDASAGYVDGYVISGGQLRKQSAGGISQGATTLYNAAWFAGLEDVEHQPHTMYFDRYPAGREATLYYGSIDLKFKNTTDNAVMITGSVNKSASGGKGSITFQIWGVKQWEIVSPEPTKSGFYNGTTIKETSDECEPQSPSPGFTASYYRIFKQNGTEIRREDKSWKYSATDKVECV